MLSRCVQLLGVIFLVGILTFSIQRKGGSWAAHESVGVTSTSNCQLVRKNSSLDEA